MSSLLSSYIIDKELTASFRRIVRDIPFDIYAYRRSMLGIKLPEIYYQQTFNF